MTAPQTARQAGLIHCHVCQRLTPEKATSRCPRCHTLLEYRKRESITRTWALVITAIILYIPANLYPIMTVIRLGRGEPNTILSGIEELLRVGMWPLSMLVFVASIVIPLAKMAVLIFLLLSVQQQSRWRPRERTILYRLLEGFGHWSMVDVFLVSLLAALVDMGRLATIQPEIGVVFFAAVVVVTILATHAFDPRLLWDWQEQEYD